MCNNKTIRPGYISKDVVAASVALESLEAVWARNNSCGVATIWTTDGPRFFNMAKISPRDALIALKDETGADWATVLTWVKSATVDDLH